MKLKTLLALIVGGCFLGSIAFGQTVQLTGTVTDLNSTLITMQVDKNVWTVKRTSNTRVLSGELKVGSTVTVECPAPDAQRKEAPPAMPTGSSSPSSG